MFLGLLPLILSVATTTNAQTGVWRVQITSTDCSEANVVSISATYVFFPCSWVTSPCKCNNGLCEFTVCLNYTASTWPTIPSHMIGWYERRDCVSTGPPSAWYARLPGCSITGRLASTHTYFSCNQLTGALEYRMYYAWAGGCPLSDPNIVPQSQCQYPSTCSVLPEPSCSRYRYSSCGGGAGGGGGTLPPTIFPPPTTVPSNQSRLHPHVLVVLTVLALAWFF